MIKPEALLPGDLLLTKATARSFFLWKLLGFFQVLIGQGGSYHRTYSHVALYEGERQVLEMTWPTSRRRAFRPEDPELEAWRCDAAQELMEVDEPMVKQGLAHAGETSLLRSEIILRSCRQRLGQRYDLLPLLTFGKVGGPRVCSTWVNVGFLQAGIVLSSEGAGDELVTPNEIADSKITRRVA